MSITIIAIILLLNQPFVLGLTVGLSLYVTVIVANLIGIMLPLVAAQMKLDPAIMSSPLITTIVDAASLIAYFSIARFILNI